MVNKQYYNMELTMPNYPWQLAQPITDIFFDCDGTLVSIEGINELAKTNDVAEEVKQLTENAMGKTGINPELYAKRLNLTKPTQQQVLALGQQYCTKVTDNAREVIKIFQSLDKNVSLISAGLKPAIAILGSYFDIPAKQQFAVDIYFDTKGRYRDFDRKSLLVYRIGKKEILQNISKNNSDIAFIGDSLDDYLTQDVITRFIGYGGFFYREVLDAKCKFYIRTPSLASLLPLLLTNDEYEKLDAKAKTIYKMGLQECIEGKVKTPSK